VEFGHFKEMDAVEDVIRYLKKERRQNYWYLLFWLTELMVIIKKFQ
jgi:hypothetical protein